MMEKKRKKQEEEEVQRRIHEESSEVYDVRVREKRVGDQSGREVQR